MIDNLVSKARRRILWNEALAQSALAAAVTIGGVALLLILGTRYLEWWTITLFAGAGLAYGAYRVWRRIPDAYTTAVHLDENAGLQDTLSTAIYFAERGSTENRGSEAFRKVQLQNAEAIAGRVDLERAIPFTLPPALYALAGLCVFVSVLVGLRFSTGHGLDLRAPLTQILFEDQALPLAKNTQKKGPRGNGESLERAIDQALKGPEKPDDKKEADPLKNGDSKAGGDQAPGDPMANEDPSNIDKVDLEGNNAAKDGDNADKKQGKELSDAQKESLYSKLKEAVSNLLSKNKQEGNKGEQKGQKQQQAKNSDSKKGEKGEKGDKEKGGEQGDSQEADAEADAQRAQQDAQAKQNSASNQQAQEGDGIGKQDGKKEIKAAEQLKAMGKISEIIGQRAATVSGETTLEQQSGNQQLTTAYSNSSAAHGETDGDVTRDQIPLGLQAYVQEYFQQVRKASAPQKKAAAAAPAPVKTTP